MGFLSQKIERSQVAVGDHIYTWRSAFIYSHHGIYIGESKVVHFTDAFGRTPGPFSWCSSCCVPAAAATTSNSMPSGCAQFPDCGIRQPRSGVVLSCLDCFLAKGSLYRFDYGVSTISLLFKFRGGTCTTAESDPPGATLHRTLYLLQHGFGDYHIKNNNCEHFAMYCKTGYICTSGGGIGQAAAFKAPFDAGAIGSLAMLIPGVSIAATTATAAGTNFGSRYYNDLGVRADVKEVQVEDLVVSRGSVNPTNTATDEMEAANSEEKRDVQPVGEGSSVAPPSIDEIIKELLKPLKPDRADSTSEEMGDVDETLRSRVQTIKDDFVKKLVKMDPLAPKEMIAFANSSLKFLSLFPFDEVDSLFFSVKNFIVRAYELAYEKRKVHSDSLDFNTKLEEARERIRVLTEEQKRLEVLSSEADQRGGLKAFDDQTKPSISQLPDLEAERECNDAYFRCIQIDLEQISKELSDASNHMIELD